MTKNYLWSTLLGIFLVLVITGCTTNSEAQVTNSMAQIKCDGKIYSFPYERGEDLMWIVGPVDKADIYMEFLKQEGLAQIVELERSDKIFRRRYKYWNDISFKINEKYLENFSRDVGEFPRGHNYLSVNGQVPGQFLFFAKGKFGKYPEIWNKLDDQRDQMLVEDKIVDNSTGFIRIIDSKVYNESVLYGQMVNPSNSNIPPKTKNIYFVCNNKFYSSQEELEESYIEDQKIAESRRN